MKRIQLRRRCALFVFLAAIVAHAASSTAVFLYDDIHSIRENHAFESLGDLPRLLVDPAAFSSLDAFMWRPVLLVTFALNHATGGGDPLPFRITDILLHGTCAFALFAVAVAMGARLRVATLLGMLFAVHPLGSEAVSFTSSRSDQLLTLGCLIAVRSHLARLRGARGAVFGTLAGMLIACGSKETGVLVPGALIAAELAVGAPAAARVVRLRAIALRVAPSVAFAMLWLAVRHHLLAQVLPPSPAVAAAVAMAPGAPGPSPWVVQWCAMASVLPRFLAQTVVPVQLSPDPPIAAGVDPFAFRAIVGWGFVLALTALGLVQHRRRPLVFFGTALAWVIAAPWVLVPLNAPAGEHRFYGVLAGLALCVGGAIAPALLRRRAIRCACGFVLLCFAAQTVRIEFDYSDGNRLWSRALAVDPTSRAGLCGLAQVAYDQACAARSKGDDDSWVREMRRALDLGKRATLLHPDDLSTRRNVVRYRLQLGPEHGEPLLAVAESRALVRERPRNPGHRILLAESLVQAGTATDRRELFEEAEKTALSCLEFAAPKALVWRAAAEACAARGDDAAALAHLDTAMERGFTGAPVRLDRAAALSRLGRGDEARREVQRVLVGAPFDARARQLAVELSVPPR